jgi:leucyl-tRNA synthetase
MPQMIDAKHLPIALPEVEKYLPTETGDPPLGNAEVWAWDSINNKVVSNDLVIPTERRTSDEESHGKDDCHSALSALDVESTNENDVTLSEVERSQDNGIYPLELNTMPGWAGSSWYFNRYMDANNKEEFASQEALNYWKDVDLYIGGSEHATGHLLYARFWQKFLFDKGVVPVDEFAKKLINQGMILGEGAFIYELMPYQIGKFNGPVHLIKEIVNELYEVKRYFISSELKNNKVEIKKIEARIAIESNKQIKSILENNQDVKVDFELGMFYVKTRIDICHLIGTTNNVSLPSLLDEKDYLDIFKPEFITELDNNFIAGREVEKMSKSKYNVVNPDNIVKDYGADSLRLYEMFLGPLEQAKPWNTAGITGVHGFLKKLWKLYHQGENGGFYVDDSSPLERLGEALKTLHKTIKKVEEDIENFSFNTSVSTFMIAVNELTAQKCTSKKILEPLLILMSPYAPHIAEHLYACIQFNKIIEVEDLPKEYKGISTATFPIFEASYLVESSKTYPISFNGKMRFTLELSLDLSKDEIEKVVMAHEKTIAQLQGREPKKVIVVPGKIVNIVG